ncbi:DUF4397 domain-containing protein [Microlunatus flavus]|uniref:DUF4397 domain-containing protein n=1 Tax=Microlunatus flavus TaxID=1036181 RepID=A0A1H9I758_9ACTN|nr:DUF4397 domain-containing protein [Microlunatus flavus]SEQ70414.1 protein of unknown function [Microlunatus flavus]
MTARALRRLLTLVVLLGATVGLAGLTAGPSFAAGTASVYVVQGLPGRTVDVTVDGRTVAKGVKTAAVVGPFKVKPGSRKISFSDGGDQLLSRSFDVKARSSWDVVVHLPAGGSTDPTVTVFRNDTSAVPRGKAELVVAHTATVPAADIRVNGKVLFSDIANGQSLNLTVPVATYKVAITPTGKKSPIYLGPVSLTVKGGAVNRVYALGDPENNTMNVAVHVLAAGSSGSERPKKVDTGTGGEAAGVVRFLAKLTR